MAVDDAFRAADDARRAEEARRAGGAGPRYPGCTALVAVVWQDHLWVRGGMHPACSCAKCSRLLLRLSSPSERACVSRARPRCPQVANAGDCRAVLCRDGSAVDLSAPATALLPVLCSAAQLFFLAPL